MKKYLVRIILMDGKKLYTSLDDTMLEHGFQKKLISDEGQIELPKGEYSIAENITSEHLFLRTKTILENKFPRNNVFIIECTLWWRDFR